VNEPTEKLAAADGPVPEPVPGSAPPHNRGWFRPADRRINRGGRPPKPNPLPPGVHPADCAARADRVQRLVLPARELAGRLAYQNGFWLTNLPRDAEIVTCRVDAGRVVFVLRSERFPQVARGEPIPEFKAYFNGLKWRQDEGWRPHTD
jgi:hypothetical protein